MRAEVAEAWRYCRFAREPARLACARWPGRARPIRPAGPGRTGAEVAEAWRYCRFAREPARLACARWPGRARPIRPAGRVHSTHAWRIVVAPQPERPGCGW